MKIRIFVLLLFCLALSFSSVFAGWDKKPEFRWTQLYRYDERIEEHSLFTNRASLIFSYLDEKEQPLLKVMPFFEIRRNFDEGIWERRELGIEIGKDILPFLYLGESIQGVWKKEDFKTPQLYEKENSTEAKTKLMFSHKIFSKGSFNLKGFIIEEYTYDTDEGRGMRNEVAIGVSAPFAKFWEAGLNCRHIDRIHYYDSDTIEISATLVF